MNLTPFQRLRALGVMPLRLRARSASAAGPSLASSGATALRESPPQVSARGIYDRRIALLRSREEIEQPALAALYTKISEAVSALGLQCVRVADAQNDRRVRVLAFGDIALPERIDVTCVLRVDSLSVLSADRARKRVLWNVLQGLAPAAESK